MTTLMGADLNNIVKCQALSDEHVQFLVYQLLRGLKVGRWALPTLTEVRARPGGSLRSPRPFPSCSTYTRRGSSTG